jgi:adenylate cyclase class 2
MPMQTEIEVKYLDIVLDDIRTRLKDAGAVCEQPMRLLRRTLIEEPHHRAKHGFIRIRDQGDKITMAYKQRDDEFAMHGTKEIEVEVSDFQNTVDLLEAAGWPSMTYQESRRETWNMDDVEVVIDEWPWIDPYIEIEGPTESSVRRAAEKLGFAWEDHILGSVDVIYERDYPKMTVRGIIDIKEARFGDSVPAVFLGKTFA